MTAGESPPSFEWTPEWVEVGWIRYRRSMLMKEVEGVTLWDLEAKLLDEVGTLLSERRPIHLDELKLVAQWRRLNVARLSVVQEDFLHGASRVAFSPSTPNYLRHLILMLVKGVGLQLASAVLKLYDRFTFIGLSSNVKKALQWLGIWGSVGSAQVAWDDPSGYGYYDFVRSCQRLAGDLGVDLCNLERALYQWVEDSKRYGRMLDLKTWRELP